MSQDFERLTFSERWLRDGLTVLRPALSVVQITVDMSRALGRLDQLRAGGVQATATHLVVSAAARALRANPDLHQLVAGNRRQRPARIDIGLSVSGESFVAPVLVIEAADEKSLEQLAEETARRTPDVRAADRRLQHGLDRWGWMVPLGVARRAVLRTLFRSPAFSRGGAGTFQVTTVPGDWALTSSFATAGVLAAGQVRDRVIPVNGQPAVRPTMTLTLSGDHAIWNGRSAARFLSAVRVEMEG